MKQEGEVVRVCLLFAKNVRILIFLFQYPRVQQDGRVVLRGAD